MRKRRCRGGHGKDLGPVGLQKIGVRPVRQRFDAMRKFHTDEVKTYLDPKSGGQALRPASSLGWRIRWPISD